VWLLCVCVCVCVCVYVHAPAHACVHAHLPSQRMRICMMIIQILWVVNTLSLKCQFDMA